MWPTEHTERHGSRSARESRESRESANDANRRPVGASLADARHDADVSFARGQRRSVAVFMGCTRTGARKGRPYIDPPPAFRISYGQSKMSGFRGSLIEADGELTCSRYSRRGDGFLSDGVIV